MAEFWGFDQADVDGLVFTSYNSLDWKRVSPIALELRKLGVPVWYDYGLNAGTDTWGAQISLHIDKASALVIFVTKGIFEREDSYVIEEYKEAKRLGHVVVPVFVDDVTNDKFYRTIDVKYRKYLNYWEDLQGVAFSPKASAQEIAQNVKGVLDRSPHISYPLVPWDNNKAKMKKKAEETKAMADREAEEKKARLAAEENARAQAKSSVSVGSRVQFGRYPQSSYDPEPITWRVLDIRDGKALMISEEILDCKQYNELTHAKVTWETCALRKWLNDDFLNKAFSPDEQKNIATVRNINPNYPVNHANSGNPTDDKVFCLSADEVEKYMNGRAKKARTFWFLIENTYPDRMSKPTAYAKKNGASDDNRPGNGDWWLRTPWEHSSYSSDMALFVDHWGVYGSDAFGGVSSYVEHFKGVRPVILAAL